MEAKVYVVLVGRKYLVLRWKDPETGRWREKSAKTTNLRQAQKLAAQLEADLQHGRHVNPSRISWDEFRTRYEREKLLALAGKTRLSACSALNHVEQLMAFQRLAEVNSASLSMFQARLRATGIRETSIASHLRHLRAALSWAQSVGMLAVVPKVQMPKRARGQTLMRGRPITTDEFERMVSVIPRVRPADASDWEHLLRGLWLSGLRLGESQLLGWDAEALISVWLSGRHPKLRILAAAEKGHQDRLLPITPDFAEFLLATPPAERHGGVFRVGSSLPDETMTAERVGRNISAIGKRAGVMVNQAANKFASAHDLRRAFGTRWSSRVKPATLQLLMRHKSIETTLKYYVEQNADDVADELWGAFKGPV